MSRASKRRNYRARSRPDKEVRTVDVPLDVCTDVVRRVIADEVGARVQEPTTGFFHWTEGSALTRVRYTLRTYAAEPGTRITLEAQGDLPAWVLALVALALLMTAGLAVLFVVPLLASARSERQREVRMFKWLRAIDLALTPSQGSYRVAQGALMHAPASRPRPLASEARVRLLPPSNEDEDDLEPTETARASRKMKLGRRK